ncbi:putative bZIP transcription factor (Atf21) [Aspergillus nomiae NRRL 13137]|uniref:Basic leucine zipper (bZIP) transcription factor atfB n=1 Tax=Aspergillus nomiae NRRL (strain ATCC 15546 / NRRL 13137 / CBS 260.88 / M93) TaxID=1509407 RepID=A0A0L1IKC7_ASPN3|nr:putative bZIP transcription factor (Atf21) [Aspergillus nomiae NRRL 13137]KNG79942.1 putative bZIP transcription factor (Atf21) [Aspergillus nomiae NRRL 13137]
MSVEQPLYRRDQAAMTDPTGADSAAFAAATAFSQPDLLAFSLPEEEPVWGFETIVPAMASWPSKMEPQTFCNPSMEGGFKNTRVRNGQPTPPPFDDKKLQPPMGETYPLAPFVFTSSPPEFAPRNSAAASASAAALDDPRQERAKREKFLERNRLAASKCRQKKKEHTKHLEIRYREVSSRKSELEAEIEHLRGEVLNLKNEMLRHAQCGDEAIKLHLAQMVRMITSKDTPHRDVVSPVRSPEQHTAATPHGLSFGFDGPMQLPSEMGSPLDQRRASEQSILTDSSYTFTTDDGFEELINV